MGVEEEDASIVVVVLVVVVVGTVVVVVVVDDDDDKRRNNASVDVAIAPSVTDFVRLGTIGSSEDKEEEALAMTDANNATPSR